MNNVNKTLYIPLYGKAYVSRKGIILNDKKAEEIWDKEGFELKGKAASKELAYYMGMRSKVFDDWVSQKMDQDTAVLHLGCGLDSRVLRVHQKGVSWYDVDFESVISERQKYYQQTDDYHMIASDVRDTEYLRQIEQKKAVVVMEGLSMYLQVEETKKLMNDLSNHFEAVYLLVDVYTVFAAKASKIKNPVNEVGVTDVVGIDNPYVLCDQTKFKFIKKHEMTPRHLIDELNGMEKTVFKTLYAGKIADKAYRLYEYVKEGSQGCI